MSAATSRRRTDAAARVRLLVLDVDGVMTDGRLYYGARGEALKIFHVRDGFGMELLRRRVTVAVISGRRSAWAAGAAESWACANVTRASRTSSPPFSGCARGSV